MPYEYQVEIGEIMYGMDSIKSANIKQPLFEYFGAGNAMPAEFHITFIPKEEPPRMAKIVPFCREEGEKDWHKLGIFFVDVRSEDRQWKNLIAYDSMLKTEQTYLISEDVGEWPRGMKALVADIASRIDVEVDSRTVINESYVVEYPNDYTMREILCHIAAAHAGNWIITADGKLLLVPLFTAMPPETYYLIEDSGSAIVFGEDRILV